MNHKRTIIVDGVQYNSAADAVRHHENLLGSPITGSINRYNCVRLLMNMAKRGLIRLQVDFKPNMQILLQDSLN